MNSVVKLRYFIVGCLVISIVARFGCFVNSPCASLSTVLSDERFEGSLPSLDATLGNALSFLVLSAVFLPVWSVHGCFACRLIVPYEEREVSRNGPLPLLSLTAQSVLLVIPAVLTLVLVQLLPRPQPKAVVATPLCGL